MLRDPTERAFSAFQMNVRPLRESELLSENETKAYALEFHEHVEKETLAIKSYLSARNTSDITKLTPADASTLLAELKANVESALGEDSHKIVLRGMYDLQLHFCFLNYTPFLLLRHFWSIC